MKCPYYVEHNNTCQYLKGVVDCEGELLKGLSACYTESDGERNHLIPVYSFHCPVNGQLIGNEEEVTILWRLRERLELDSLDDKL